MSEGSHLLPLETQQYPLPVAGVAVVPTCLAFPLPWFQLLGISYGPEADDPLSDVPSEGQW